MNPKCARSLLCAFNNLDEDATIPAIAVSREDAVADADAASPEAVPSSLFEKLFDLLGGNCPHCPLQSPVFFPFHSSRYGAPAVVWEDVPPNHNTVILLCDVSFLLNHDPDLRFLCAFLQVAFLTSRRTKRNTASSPKIMRPSPYLSPQRTTDFSTSSFCTCWFSTRQFPRSLEIVALLMFAPRCGAGSRGPGQKPCKESVSEENRERAAVSMQERAVASMVECVAA